MGGKVASKVWKGCFQWLEGMLPMNGNEAINNVFLTTKKRKISLPLGTPAGVRTLDTLIKSQVLYQLSYGCMFLECGCKGTAFF